MANQLKMGVIDSIFTLHRRGWSVRRIARELGIHRETVARYLRHGSAGSKPANAPIGAEGVDGDPKPANAPIGPAAPSAASPRPTLIGRPSDCEPYRAII